MKVRCKLTEAREAYYHEGAGLCFAELSVDRLANVSRPSEKRGRTYAAAMSASLPGFALDDGFDNFVRAVGAIQLGDSLKSANASELYSRQHTFIRNDDGCSVRRMQSRCRSTACA